MAWVFLACAGLLEVFWSSFLKLSDGFTKLGWSVMTIAGMLASFYLLSQAMKTLPLGILIFKEPVTAARMFFTVLLLTGIVGIKLTSSH